MFCVVSVVREVSFVEVDVVFVLTGMLGLRVVY